MTPLTDTKAKQFLEALKMVVTSLVRDYSDPTVPLIDPDEINNWLDYIHQLIEHTPEGPLLDLYRSMAEELDSLNERRA